MTQTNKQTKIQNGLGKYADALNRLQEDISILVGTIRDLEAKAMNLKQASKVANEMAKEETFIKAYYFKRPDEKAKKKAAELGRKPYDAVKGKFKFLRLLGDLRDLIVQKEAKELQKATEQQ